MFVQYVSYLCCSPAVHLIVVKTSTLSACKDNVAVDLGTSTLPASVVSYHDKCIALLCNVDERDIVIRDLPVSNF